LEKGPCRKKRSKSHPLTEGRTKTWKLVTKRGSNKKSTKFRPDGGKGKKKDAKKGGEKPTRQGVKKGKNDQKELSTLGRHERWPKGWG